MILHGIILGHDPLVLHTENLGAVRAGRDEGGARLGHLHPKTVVMLGGRRHLRYFGQRQLVGQPILQGSAGSLSTGPAHLARRRESAGYLLVARRDAPAVSRPVSPRPCACRVRPGRKRGTRSAPGVSRTSRRPRKGFRVPFPRRKRRSRFSGRFLQHHYHIPLTTRHPLVIQCALVIVALLEDAP